MECLVCKRYDLRGFGNACPCVHVDGKCVNPVLKENGSMEMYSVYDRKVREYGAILLAPNVGAMGRQVQVGVRGSNSLMEKYPEDFEIHKVGTFDTDTGEVVAPGRPEIVAPLTVVLGVDVAKP